MDKYAVIGLGRFGAGLARALAGAGAEVIAIDRQSKPVDRVRDEVTLAVRLDSTDEEALRSQGVGDVDAAIVGIGDDFESSALTVAVLKDLGVPYIVARAENEIQERILRSVGAHEVSSPEYESALRWAHRLQLPVLGQYIELGDEHSVISVPAADAFVGKTLLELDFRNTYGANLIAIERPIADAQAAPDRKTRRTLIVPTGKTTIQAEDVLVLVGANDALTELPRN